ncbi:CsgG/HfaB family protein [Sphingomonas edaphi]|jgi:curli biogenesis system outer membrane secretion channel CsgG|uniref:Penicillin-binding protein activator LpoB n=1 Tax=Sphingomonas edaphi TaxID=2315689 RepID=A0A418PXZ5_9SPHN|nr:CsgG/HfaB family protein [Sphingomonas edaphi]RIX26869.1 penicillin-binding protein activator LpoB [Sphingomonas edaphi]
MSKSFMHAALASAVLVTSAPALAQTSNTGASESRKMQSAATAQIPQCARPLGVLAIVEPEDQWWRQLNLGSPEAVIKVFVQNSRCFTIVNRGRSMQSRAMERALADSGELQQGSNLGKGQVKAADFFLEPNIVTANQNSGGGGAGAAIGALGGLFGGGGRFVGGLVGGINVKKGEANVTLSVVNARTTEEYVVEGYARKKDISWGAGGGGGWWSGFAAAGGHGYQNTEIGQVIVLAYLDAYTKLVGQLGGIPQGAPAAR